MNRRQLLRSVTAGLAGILASRRPPAHAQTTRLHLLFRVDFIPQGEAELKRQLADYGKQMKMDVEDGLPGFAVAVEDRSISTFRVAMLFREGCCRPEH